METVLFVMLSFALFTSFQMMSCLNPTASFQDWFQKLDSDLHIIYQHAAHFAWELRYRFNQILHKFFSLNFSMENY